MKTISNVDVKINEYKEFYLVSLNNTNKISILNSNVIESKVAPLTEGINKSIYLDLKEINFIDSKGFNMLLKIQRLAFLHNISLVIYNLDEELKELFDLLGLISEFEISKNGPILKSKNVERKVS